jgi:hypothetical protein
VSQILAGYEDALLARHTDPEEPEWEPAPDPFDTLEEKEDHER